MVIGTLFLAIAITCAGLTYYFLGLYQNIVWIWVPFVLAFAFYWAVFFVAIGTIGLLAEAWKKSKKPDHPRPAYIWLLRQMCVQALLFLRVRVHATGLGKLPEKEPFMLVSNHLSIFDHICLNAALNRWPSSPSPRFATSSSSSPGASSRNAATSASSRATSPKASRPSNAPARS